MKPTFGPVMLDSGLESTGFGSNPGDDKVDFFEFFEFIVTWSEE